MNLPDQAEPTCRAATEMHQPRTPANHGRAARGLGPAFTLCGSGWHSGTRLTVGSSQRDSGTGQVPPSGGPLLEGGTVGNCGGIWVPSPSFVTGSGLSNLGRSIHTRTPHLHLTLPTISDCDCCCHCHQLDLKGAQAISSEHY